MFEIYKRGQGTMARWISAISLGAMAAFGAYEMWVYLDSVKPGSAVPTVAAALLFVAAAGATAWLINWPKFVDYLIMSEAELRKVSWPTRDELKRQTVVVIFTLVVFAALLLVADLAFAGVTRMLYKL